MHVGDPVTLQHVETGLRFHVDLRNGPLQAPPRPSTATPVPPLSLHLITLRLISLLLISPDLVDAVTGPCRAVGRQDRSERLP